jgi:hypothetical protein
MKAKSKTVKGYQLTFHIEGVGMITRKFRTIINGIEWIKQQYPDQSRILKKCEILYT